MRLFRILLNLVLLLAVIGSINCDYYTSISGLEELLSVENYYLESLEKHLNEVEKLNSRFQSLLEEVELEHSKIKNNTPRYFDDPVNTFKVIRRLVVERQQLAELTWQINNLKVFNESLKISPDEFTPPKEEDLRGAALGLSRLQNMYKLDSGHMARGYLMGRKYSSDMSASNCFVLGQSLYEAGEHLVASEWLIEGLHKTQDIESGFEEEKEAGENIEEKPNEAERYNNDAVNEIYQRDDDQDLEDDDSFPYVSTVEILEYLPSALYNGGRRNLALIMNNKLQALDPQNKYGLANKQLFENSVKEERRKRTLEKAPVVSELQRIYGQVCSGELKQTAREKRHLRCRYVTNDVPFYFVGPLKMEELNSDPYVAYYHEIIYDSEIDQIIETVEDSIERSTVGEKNVNEIRVSKGDWLSFENHRFLDKISLRLEDITGLTIETGEQLQVANYGIGGHYGPHYDFFFGNVGNFTGNRILTALFYINDVELGGATAFPILRLAVPPVKGSLVVWYNMHKSVEPDYRTWHAGCPVLQGSKWICNEWFNHLGQELKRPCDLQPDDTISESYKDL